MSFYRYSFSSDPDLDIIAMISWVKDVVTQLGKGKWELTVTKPNRSERQNRWYWGEVVDSVFKACLQAGISTTPEGVHEHFKRKYLTPRGSVDINGNEILIPPSTTKLNTAEFSEYILNIMSDEQVVEMGVIIDLPDEIGRKVSSAG